MTICAVCQLTDGLIVNIIVAEPTDPAPDGCQLIVTPDSLGNNAQIGGTWDGTQFLPPPESA
jgi:hypothetical protein